MKNKHRTIFISDIHLGTRGCQAELLVKFLKENDADQIYLVGDIIDAWRMQRGVYWPDSHNEVLRQLLKKSHNGTKIHWILGNHDEVLRKWVSFDLTFGNIHVSNRVTHIDAKGKKWLVTHGDMFDAVMKKELKWLMHVGDVAYNMLIAINTRFNAVRRFFGMKYWSLSKFLKNKTKQALNFIDGFEDKVCGYARDKKYDGVICGHIHHANIKEYDDVTYMNTGDWVESCTAIIEDEEGNFYIKDYS